jgi:eukaryotic-like serine/threonine-protein kinase
VSEDQDIRGRAEQRIGSVLHGKYRLDGILGVGGMAVVYAATHRNQKKLAVKILNPELSLRTEVRTRFLREGYAANAVEHEGVVAILDDDVDDSGCAFLVMELLQGLDAQAWRTRSGGRLPLQAALAVAYQLLEVLGAAHAKGVIHRDIKPANLFMQVSGRLKVLDFGIARVRERALGSDATRTGALLGTPAFMAPELASAQGDQIDARTDLWAVGATLFSLLSGEHVHPGEHANQVLIRAATAQARSVLSVCPELPPPVVELLARALAFEKGARFQSAADMAGAVERVHAQLYGDVTVESVPSLLAALAALPAPASRASSAVGAAVAGAGATVSEVGVSEVAVAEPPRRALMPSIEPILLSSPGRARPRRVTPLLGVSAALLCAGLAFDWYVSRTAHTLRSSRQAAVQVAPAFPSSATEVSLRAAVRATSEPPLPSLPSLPAPGPAGVAPAVVAAPHPSRPAPLRRSTVTRSSPTSTAPTLASARASQNPLDVELQ